MAATRRANKLVTGWALGAIALVFAPAAPAAPAAASAHVATARLGQVSATLTYQGSFPTFTDLHLTITDSGRRAYDQAVNLRQCRDCGPIAVSPGRSPLKIADLEANGRPDVVLGLYSGGAHCCITDQVYRPEPGAHRYAMTSHPFADAGARVVRRGGRYVFLSADVRFAYVFTSFAASGFPIQIWSFASGRFADITDSYPALVATDADSYLAAFKKHTDDGEGLIGAWAADEERLGNGALVTSTLDQERQAGHLETLAGGLGGRAFITELIKLLRRYGYIR
jgi:hypothetical protein